MRKLLFLKILSLMTISTFAASTGTLQLQGIVPEVFNIAVTTSPSAGNLDLSSTQTDLQVGSIVEQSNSSTGYQITISSLNDGALLRSGGSETFNYTLKYDGQSVSLSGSSTTPVVAKTQGTGGVHNNTSNVAISYSGVSNSSMMAGSYQDTLTFEISAN